MLIVKTEKSKKGKNYLALILERENYPKVYLSFDRNVICRVLCISYGTYYELLAYDNYISNPIND